MSPTLRGLIVVAALALTLAPFLAVEIPAGYDMTKNLLVARILYSIDDPALGYSQYYEPDLGLRPASAGYAILAALHAVAEPFVALKIFLALFVVSTWFAGYLFLRARGVEEAEVGAIALLPLCHSYMVYTGLLPYFASFPLFPLLLAAYYRLRNPARRFVALAALFFVLYLFHIVSLAVGAFAVAVLALFDWRRGEPVRRTALDFAAMVPAFTVAVAAFFGGERRPALDAALQSPLYSLKVFLGFNVTSLAANTEFFLGAGYVALMAACAYGLLRRRIDMPLLTIAASLTVIGLVVPVQLGEWWLAGPRTFAFSVMAAVGALNLGPLGRKALGGAALVVLLGSSVLNVQAARSMQERFDVFLSGLDAVEPGSYILPILRDPLFPAGTPAQVIPGVHKRQDPFWGIADAYVILRGGATPYAFAYPAVRTNATALTTRAPLEHLYWYEQQESAPAAERYRGVGETYDYVLLFGETPELEAVLDREMDRAFENGPLLVYRSRQAP